MAWKEHHARAKRAHGVLGAFGAGNKAHAEKPEGHPLHVAHHAHGALDSGLKAFEGVLTIGEKVMWTGIKWGVVSVATIGALTALTHGVDGLHQFEGAFDWQHDLVYGLGIGVPVTGITMGRRGWIEGKAIAGHLGNTIDHSESTVRSVGKMPSYTRARAIQHMDRIRNPRT